MTNWPEHTMHDLRFAIRGWRTSPGFTIGAVATLALGIGANTAIFTIVSGVLLRPLPLPQPDRLVQLEETSPSDVRLPPRYVTSRGLEEWRAGARSLEAASTYGTTSRTLRMDDDTEQVATVRADHSLFDVLRARPMLGRVFTTGDPVTVAVASAAFWRRRFGADPSALGRTLSLDGETVTLIGVMPDAFQFPYRSPRTDLWVPWTLPPKPNPNARLDAIVGRLRAGATVDEAGRELSLLSARVSPGRTVVVTPLSEVVGGPVRTPLLVLLGAVALVLLVACANVANLLLARTAARAREVAIRLALGASRQRLIRQFLTESLLLAIAGGTLGLGIAWWGSHLLIELAGAQIPRAWEIGFDWRVFAFQAAACLLTGIGFGLAPAFAGSRATAREALKERDPASRIRGRARDVLIVVEVALAFVLLAGAGLLLRTFLALQGAPAGFDPTHVLTVHVVVRDAEESRAIEDRVAQIPGIRSAGFISLLPLQGSDWYGRFAVTGRQTEASAEFRYVTPNYFTTMGIPIVRGRALSARDSADAPKVLLVNESLARQYFPGEDPIGQVLTGRGTIVGVTGDVRQTRLDRPAVPEIYYPVAQNFAQLRSAGSTLVIRSELPIESVAGAVRAALREVNPNLAAFRVLTMEDVVDESIATHRLYLWLLGLFAGLGTLLAAAGIYGVVTYLVTLRTREFGIRMALGADASRVLRLVMGRGAALVAMGLSIGIAGALAATRVLNTLLYGVSATDVWTYGGMALLLVAVALTACAVPAARATRVNPAIALRTDL